MKFKLAAFLFFGNFFFLSLLGHEEPKPIRTANGTVIGLLNHVEAQKNKPLVIIVSGSGLIDEEGGQCDGENNSLMLLSDELKKKGISTFRIEKAGFAFGQEMNLRFETYVEAIKNCIDSLYEDKRFSKIILVGYNDGALMGMLAADKNLKISSFVSISGHGKPAHEMVKEKFINTSEVAKKSIYDMLDTLKNGKIINNVSNVYYKLFRPSIQPYLISWFKYNPQVEIKKLAIPILIIQGSTDLFVREKNAQLLFLAKPTAEKKVIKNMNHLLKDCDKLDMESQIAKCSSPELGLNKVFIAEIGGFINRSPLRIKKK